MSSSAECKIRTLEVWDTKSPADWMSTHKPTELSRIKLKTWTQQPVLMVSEHLIKFTVGCGVGMGCATMWIFGWKEQLSTFHVKNDLPKRPSTEAGWGRLSTPFMYRNGSQNGSLMTARCGHVTIDKEQNIEGDYKNACGTRMRGAHILNKPWLSMVVEWIESILCIKAKILYQPSTIRHCLPDLLVLSSEVPPLLAM